mmetsp:Transcript_70684/g.223789  ORF Transcript_70684/g.223789 Transcript_70684/m.223789 type:complete len:221 (-) Transcript_70684:207-869(-)
MASFLSNIRGGSSRAKGGSKVGGKEMEKIDAFFDSYKDEGEDDVVGPTGIERLCGELGLDPSDARVLQIAWKMGAEKMGFFSREEWRRGMSALRATSADKLKKSLPGLEEELGDDCEAFRSFFAFAFSFCLMEPGQKTLELETAVQMLKLVLADEPLVPSLAEFLEDQTEYKGINMDQWQGFLRFCEEVEQDCSNYDENEAWPLIMDNYVEWYREKHPSS